MNDAFVREFRDSIAEPEVREVNGRQRLLLPKDWKDATPDRPSAKALGIVTLTGICDYLTKNVDVLAHAELMLHVEGPALVSLIAKLEGEEENFRRQCYLEAKAPEAKFLFGQYYDSESFSIALQTCFVNTAARQELVQLVASIKESGVRETVDDGVAQEVTTRRGVALSDRTRVPNPVRLQPYRTFREVAQPESDFVLRLKEGQGDQKPSCALFEADGGAWKLEAISNVASWLQAEIKTVGIVA